MSEISVRSLHPALGAEILGFEPRQPLDDDTISLLRSTFDDRGVLVFRDLDIDEDMQRYLVYTLINEEVPPPDDSVEKAPWIVSNKTERMAAAPYGRLLFHCDTMWARRLERILSLYGLQVEPPTAPTLFVSMGDALDRLPSDLRSRLDGLQARHGFENRYPNRGGDDDVTDTYFEDSRSMVRDLVLTHPRTGRELLYASQQATIEIVGLPPEENEALLAELFTYQYEPSAILEHEWRDQDLVVWDNIAVQHGRGNVTLEGPERTLRKVGGPMKYDANEVLIPTYSKVAGD
jgi:alpha-ketoglutarate-dependent taurine dioxygenase